MIDLDEKIYEKFTALERINLTISAITQNDDQEADKLRRCAPKYYYQHHDIRFLNYLRALVLIEGEFTRLCYYHYSQIVLHETYISWFSYFNVTNPTESSDNDLTGQIECMRDIMIDHIAYLKSIHYALYQFCNEAKLDSKQLLLAITQTAYQHCDKINDYLAMETRENDDYTTHIKNSFNALWLP